MPEDRDRELNRLRQQRYRNRNRQPLEPRACAWCGTVFTPARRNDARYCCANCRSQARFQRQRSQ